MKALVTGITGQDGAYLSKLLLSKGYQVYGVARRSSVDTKCRLRELGILDNPLFDVIEGDITDMSSVLDIVGGIKPDELYNLAAQSHVYTSFNQPSYTWSVNATGCLNLLEAIRRQSPSTRFYQASTSEMFGNNYTKMENGVCYQDENTPLSPTSPYAVAKTAAHQLVQTYRKSYGIHASCGILFNHESELRGENFVTRKITKWVAGFYKRLLSGDLPVYTIGRPFANEHKWAKRFGGGVPCPISTGKLKLGNLNACRDWGHAEDYVVAMWQMLQRDTPDDYVVATGQTRTILDFVTASFMAIGINYGGEDYVRDFIDVDTKLCRPSEVNYLLGNPTKAATVLGWRPEISFEQLVQRMVDHDIGELIECNTP